MRCKPRKLVIHHDDLGGSHSANSAFTELVDHGVVTCGSVMVPGPWFSEAVDIVRRRPDLDVGVHLTLTSEFSGFRWRPLTSGQSLMDDTGHFWTDLTSARLADPMEVHAELRAQVTTALNAGIDVTHLDSHMGTAWQPEFIDAYIALGDEFQLPVVVTQDVQSLSAPHRDLDSVFDRLRQQGNPVFQKFLTTPFELKHPSITDYQGILDQSVEGLNWCGFHFAVPGDIELVTDDASTRVEEYNVFNSHNSRRELFPEDAELVGMREFRREMRA